MAFSTGDPIGSEANPRIKLVHSLRRRPVRQAERLFVVEGVRAVEDALAAGGEAAFVLVRADAEWRPPRAVAEVRAVAPRLFDRLAETEHPQPVLGVFQFPDVPEPPQAIPFVLVADGVADPGNLGTLLRSAAGAGVNLVLLTAGTVDPFNGKVVRAAMGAHFRVAMRTLDDEERARLLARCPVRVLAEADGAVDYAAVDWTGPVALIVGSEAHGPSAEGRALATTRAAIPLVNGVESLNAGVAGSILLFEVRRQRRAAGIP